MQQNRKRDQDAPTRASSMEKAEGSRERMMNREFDEDDLGTSTDRAMFDDQGESRMAPDRPSDRSSGRADERTRGSASSERNQDSSGSSNRGRTRERQSER